MRIEEAGGIGDALAPTTSAVCRVITTPTAGVGGSTPARSALTLRAVLALFGLVVSAGGAWFSFNVGLPGLGWVLVVVAVVALVDLLWILVRKGRGEPG